MSFKDLSALLWAALLYILKILLGSIALLGGIILFLKIERNQPVFGGYVSGGLSGDVLKEVFDLAMEAVPFAPYILKALGMYPNVVHTGEYAVLHDFAKMMLLFVTTSVFTKTIGLSWQRLKAFEGSGNLWLTLIFRYTGDIVLSILAIPAIVVYSCLIHDVILRTWLAIAGDGFAGNFGLFMGILLVFGGIYYALSEKGRRGFVNMLVPMLLDFGLALCVIVAFCYIRLAMASRVPLTAPDFSSIYLPILFCIVGFCVLLRIKQRR